jgi:nucleolin
MSKVKNTKKTQELSDVDLSEEEVKTTKKAVPQTKQPAAKATKPAPKKDSDDDESSSEEVVLLKSKTKGQELSKPTKKETQTSAKPQAKVVAKKPVDSDSEDESEEEVKAPAKKAPVVAKKPAKVESSDEDSDESEEEVKAPVKKAPVVAKKPAKVESSDEDSDESEEEVKPKAKVQAKQVTKDSDDESEEEVKPTNKAPAKPQQAESGCSELFLKNLSWNTNDDMIREFFGNYGEVTNVKVLFDRNTGKARGLGFVEFSKRSEAQSALNDLANLVVDGRQLTATFSDQKPENNNSQGGFRQNNNNNGFNNNRGGSSNYGGEKFTAFVGNLGFKTNENSVKKFFQDCGSVTDVRIAKNEEGRSKGFCHVDFDSAEAVEKAKSKAGQELDGREIRVDASTPRQGGGNRGGSFQRGGRGGFRGGRGGGRGGFNSDPMGRSKKTGALMTPSQNAVVTFDDDE